MDAELYLNGLFLKKIYVQKVLRVPGGSRPVPHESGIGLPAVEVLVVGAVVVLRWRHILRRCWIELKSNKNYFNFELG